MKFTCLLRRQSQLVSRPLNSFLTRKTLLRKECFWWVKRLSMIKSGSSKWSSMFSRLDAWYPLESVSCAPTLESTATRFSRIPLRLGFIGTVARWLFKLLFFVLKQELSRSIEKILWADCRFLNKFFYVQCLSIWSQNKCLLGTVVRNWEINATWRHVVVVSNEINVEIDAHLCTQW